MGQAVKVEGKSEMVLMPLSIEAGREKRGWRSLSEF